MAFVPFAHSLENTLTSRSKQVETRIQDKLLSLLIGSFEEGPFLGFWLIYVRDFL